MSTLYFVAAAKFFCSFLLQKYLPELRLQRSIFYCCRFINTLINYLGENYLLNILCTKKYLEAAADTFCKLFTRCSVYQVFRMSDVQCTRYSECQMHTPNLVIQPLPSNSAIFGYAAEWGTPQSFTHQSAETAPSLIACDLYWPVFFTHRHPEQCFWVLCTTLFEMLHELMARISWFSHMAGVSWQSGITFSKQMLQDPSFSANIRRICSKYEIVLPWFQQFISAGIITMGD